MTELEKRSPLSPGIIIISYIIFFAGWCLRVVFLDTSGLGELSAWFVGFLIHVLWWPCFALLFISKYDASLNVSLKEMVCTPPKLRILVPALGVTVAYNLIGRMLDNSGYGTDMPVYDLIITVLTVGIFEESLFRGWFLNAISVYTGERKANVISSVLFSLVHFPGWIKAGYDAQSLLITGASIFLVGLFFGYIFRKSRSIWTSSIVHSIWDMLTWIP